MSALVFSQTPVGSRSVVVWTAVAVGAPVALAACWWVATRVYDAVVPYKYHYRPGMISGWLADALYRYSIQRKGSRPVRVYMDGCFDMMHYGHANALRQAKAVGDILVVGVIPDSEILKNKGPPVLNEEERVTLVDAIKWVDEIITGVPYDLSPEFVDELFTKHKIDYIIHGDDPCLLPDGTDAYAHAKKLGRFRMIKRTEGVSTTDLVGRMLTCTRVNPLVAADSEKKAQQLARQFSHGHSGDVDNAGSSGSFCGASGAVSRFMPTSRRLVQFSNGRQAPEGAKVVYIDGAFDVFHVGHVRILQEARKQGDFLLVGLHQDEDVQERRGPHLPIMNVHERSLSVLACKFVDEVIIGAPTIITEDLLKTFNISLVVRGTKSEMAHLREVDAERYAVPVAKGCFRELQSPWDMTTATIIQRIVAKRQEFEARNARKTKSEATYYSETKTFVNEV